ncbi:MAG: ribbon-helix-helix protein, CopG family [Nitrospirae bacterium]|nr:ribbon-helix-helix protein, CopG family [Nitrospirota bacterium]MBI3352808.1 ribbon-helix-helix protein, CopG family [Nitrospirota bacterium]
MSTVKSWTVSLPPKMIKEAEKVAKEGNVSKSDLVKEALGQFLETHQWKKLQQEAAQKAKEFSFVSEEEVERNVHENRK